MINSNISEISLEGFQVVSGEMFMHLPRKSDATCTVWPTSISFSSQALTMLNSCEHIRIQVNVPQRKLLIVPVSSADKDGIRWLKCVSKPQVRKMESARFCQQLYQSWGWDTALNYRAVGRLVSSEGKVMIMFDFSVPETWRKSVKGVGEGA